MNIEDNSSFKNTTEQNEALKERLEKLEQANLSEEKKLDLALLLAQESKKAGQFGNFKVFEGETPEIKKEIIDEFQKEYQELETILSELGMSFSTIRELSEIDGVYGYSILAAMDKETLQRAIEAAENNDDKTFGKLMGYPETAVESYATDQAFDFKTELSNEELQQLEEEGVLPFINFKPSRGHWEEELEFARANKELIKERYPKLFESITKHP